MLLFASPEVFDPDDVRVLYVLVHKVEDAGGSILEWFASFEQNLDNFVPFARLGSESIDQCIVVVHAVIIP